MCHNGKKEVDLNSLAKSEIKSKLEKFKKENGLMPSIAKKLTQKDIEEIIKSYGK